MSGSSSEPNPWRGYFSPAQWRTVQFGVARRGLDPASARVIGVVSVVQGHRPFVLVAATSKAGRPCFVPVLGVRFGPTTCRLSTPVVVFTARDHSKIPSVPAQTDWAVLGLAGHGVVAVSLGDRAGSCSNATTASVDGVLTFAGTAYASIGVLRAYDAGGRVILRVDLAGRSSRSAEQIGVVRPASSRPERALPGECTALTPAGS
jgi:hypothetical protein